MDKVISITTVRSAIRECYQYYEELSRKAVFDNFSESEQRAFINRLDLLRKLNTSDWTTNYY